MPELRLICNKKEGTYCDGVCFWTGGKYGIEPKACRRLSIAPVLPKGKTVTEVKE